MTIDELKEYNKLVIDASKEVSKPWKWSTFILTFLLTGMIAFYFLFPAEVSVQQTFDGQHSIGTTNNQTS